MEVQILCRETIRPSSPTPKHLGIHKLSILEQLAPRYYIPIILFYSSTGTTLDQETSSDNLKKSLADTLSYLYPLAGRSSNGLYIDCNDAGATYIEAQVAGDMPQVLNQPEMEKLQQLLPCEPYSDAIEFGAQDLLAVQVNCFGCGGIAIGVCVQHVIAESSTLATFVQSWADIARGANKAGGGSNLIFDCTSIFVPVDKFDFSWSNQADEDLLLEIAIKRFVFNGSKMSALREHIGNGPFMDRPTRFEAVSALIWGALIAATREKDDAIKDFLLASAADFRKRMDPPLPQRCIGNICQMTTAACSVGNRTGYNELAGKIRESIRQVNDEYARKFDSRSFIKYVKLAAEQFEKGSRTRILSVSSWCRFPFYAADFGWGKPTWVGTTMKHSMGAIYLDTPDGEGIEVLLGLPVEDMARIERNSDIIQYASFR